MKERELALHVAGESGWLAEYVRYARTLTDAPLMFHLGAGLIALAGAIGSQVSWRGGGRENWPNLYVLLLAPSGIYRKSTSVDLGCGLLQAACPDRVMDREFSGERFIRNLARQPVSVLKEAEFSSLLERMKASYMAGMDRRLTELWDCQAEYSRHLQGQDGGGGGDRIVILRPALSIIAASTTDWLVASITELDLRSGFLPRFLMVPSTEKEDEPPGGYWAEQDHTAESSLVWGLKHIAAQNRVHVRVTDVVKQLVSWERGHVVERAGEHIEELSGVYSRLGAHAAKISVLLAISDGDQAGAELVLTESVVERACVWLDWVVEKSEETFNQHLIFSKFERQAQKALAYVSPEGTDRRVILRGMHVSTDELTKILKTLEERGEVHVEQRDRRTIVQRLIPASDPVTLVTFGDGSGDTSWRNGQARTENGSFTRAIPFGGGEMGP